MEHKKIKQTNKTETAHRYREQTSHYQWEEGWRREKIGVED